MSSPTNPPVSHGRGHRAITFLFTLSVVVFLLAVITAVLYLLVLLRQLHGGLRPLWPWERSGRG